MNNTDMDKRKLIVYNLWGLLLIITFITFWPVGLTLLLLTVLGFNKKVKPYLAKFFEIAGIILLVFFIFRTVVLIYSGKLDFSNLFMESIIFLIAAVLIFQYGFVLGSPKGNVVFNMSEVANQTQEITSTPVVTKIIDPDNVTTSSSFNPTSSLRSANQGSSTEQVLSDIKSSDMIISCSGCGANNYVNSKSDKCEYCGGLLKV